MANIFANGEELLNKKDFDKQINTDLPLFYQVNADKPNLQSYFSSNGGSANGIQLIYKHYSEYSTILGLAAGISRTAIEIPTYAQTPKPIVNISGTDQANSWNEQIAWQSDIEALKARISALEKQIGGTK